MPHWTEIVNHLAVAPQYNGDTEDGESDDTEWLLSVYGKPSRSETESSTVSPEASAKCAICHKGPTRWEDHRLEGKACSTCARDHGLGPFSTPQPPRRPRQQNPGHGAGSAARSPWISWRGLLTSPAAEEVGREIGGRYSITEQERRIDSNDGQPYTWKETLDYYTNKGWYVFEVKEHWNKLNRASPSFYV